MKVQTRKDKGRKPATDNGVSSLAGHKKGTENSSPQKSLTIEEIHRRAETMTPVLKEILEIDSGPLGN